MMLWHGLIKYVKTNEKFYLGKAHKLESHQNFLLKLVHNIFLIKMDPFLIIIVTASHQLFVLNKYFVLIKAKTLRM